MTSVAAVSASTYVAATYQPGTSPATSAPKPAASDPDHDGDVDTPGRVDVKA